MTFKSYHSSSVRANIIRDALCNFGSTEWKIVDRQNLASGYPSDFDLLKISQFLKDNGIQALKDHPEIKQVTPQHQVFRTLKYINDSYSDEFKEFRRFTGRSSLSLVSFVL